MDSDRPASVPQGVQTIEHGEAETLNVHDKGGVPQPYEPAVGDDPALPPAELPPTAGPTSGPVRSADPEPQPALEPVGDTDVDPFSALFDAEFGEEEPETEPTAPEPGADEPNRGVTEPPTPQTAVAPDETTQPDWLPAGIKADSLSETELLRLQLVHERASTASQLAPDEAALLHRYREASASAGTPQPAASAPPQEYQPRTIEVPEGYEGDAAIAQLVAGANQSAAEGAYLHNQSMRAIHQLQADQTATAQSAEQSAQVAAWNQFVTQHPEAADPAVQERMGNDIRLWRDPNTTLDQLWAAALSPNLPAPTSGAPMDPRERTTRGRRAAAASAATAPPATARQPARRAVDLSDLDERGASFSEYFERLHG